MSGFDVPGLAGAVTVVTGGGGGIGAGITSELCRQGADVFVLDVRPPASGDQVAGARYLECDVADEQSIGAAFATVEDEAGVPTILVNNAGVIHQSAFEEQSRAAWDRVIGINLTGVMLCCRRALPGMRKAGHGRVVSIGSSAGHTGGSLGLAAYGASKAGLHGLTKALAKEYAQHRVTVNAVAPAAIDTDMIKDLHNRPSPEAMPLGRYGTPDDVASAVAFLCSSVAGFITGSIVDVNGGLLVH
jgi:3-oxoacyl-[acyl-carrier protein] reductase